MALMNRARYKKELQEGLNTVFGLEYRRYEQEWRPIYAVENSSKAYEEDVLLAGLAGAPVKPEGSPVAYDQGGEAFVSRYVHETIALAFALTEEAEEDNLYGSIGSKYSKALARSMQHTKEVKGAATLNNGFDSNYPGGDGQELFSTAHPLYGGGTQANTFGTQADLSETSLEEALILAVQIPSLFAQALETPGGLKIQTIHAFSAALLAQFPLEANVSGRFTVLEVGFFPRRHSAASSSGVLCDAFIRPLSTSRFSRNSAMLRTKTGPEKSRP